MPAWLSSVNSHHGHFQGVGVKGANFPVAADVVDELDHAMQPENTRYDQHKNHKGIVSDSGGSKNISS